MMSRDQFFFEITLLIFASTKRFFDAPPFGEIANHCDDDSALGAFGGPKKNVDREFSAALAAAVQIEADSHRTQSRLFGETLPMARMRMLVTRGDQDFNRLAN